MLRGQAAKRLKELRVWAMSGTSLGGVGVSGPVLF